jgi:methyl-accepting chemotaxis protein
LAGGRSVARAAGVVVSALGALVLLGWALDVAVLRSVVPGLATMKANTALGFLLAGAALWLQSPESPQRRVRLGAQVCAGLVALLGVLTLAEYGSGWDLGIDQLLFREVAGGPLPVAAGRMSPATALSFVLVAAALLLLDAGRWTKTARG